MGGISFSGITQLFTAGTRPPHLAAVSPMSVTDDIYTGTGYPGGIFNSGFAQTWIQERMDDAQPAPEGGQPWARELAKMGDKHCIANQKLRLQTQDALKLQEENPFRTPSLFAQRAPGRVAEAREGADLPRRPVPGRADRRALRRGAPVPERQPERLALAPERRARRLARAEHDHALGRVHEALRGERGPEDPGLGHQPQRRCSTSTSPTPARRPWSSRASRA